MQSTVLLVNAEHFNWVGLEATVRQQPDLHVIDVVSQAPEAVRVAKTQQPDVILMAATIEGQSAASLVAHLHVASPRSKIIMIGDKLTYDELMEVMRGGILAFVEWDCLNLRTLRLCLDAMDANLLVASPAVLMALLDVPERRCPRDKGIVLTPDECVVLQRLAEGLLQHEIAEAVHMSEARVGRITAALRDKFAAPSTFVLGMKAALYGFVS
jgi:DNA-binding NarL/FixJ family response regulator